MSFTEVLETVVEPLPPVGAENVALSFDARHRLNRFFNGRSPETLQAWNKPVPG